MKAIRNKLSLFTGLLLITNISLAQQVTHTVIKSSQPTTLITQQVAKQWGLSTTDYQQYRWLMANTPSGHWYKQLDPAEVLALNTDDLATMLRYAKVQARNMHVRVNRELKFDQVYRQAYQQLYPHQQPIQSATPNHTLQKGDRLWLFVKLSSPLGPFVYQRLIQHVQASPGSVLDIYFVGKDLKQSAIQAWATSVGMLPSQVNHLVTLNYGNQRFATVSKDKSISLPYAGIVHQQHFSPISLSSMV